MTESATKLMKKLREDAGLTVREMADELGMPAASSYQHYEKGFKGRYMPSKMGDKLEAFVKAHDMPIERANELTGRHTTGDEDPDDDLLRVPFYDFRPGMGGGGVVITERPTSHMPLHPAMVRRIRLDGADLMAVEVEGDSMNPTLASGDHIIINRMDKNPARGGIFAIFDSDTLVVKRIEKIPATDPVMLRLISDNQHHGSYDVIADDTNIIGRVVWYARRI